MFVSDYLGVRLEGTGVFDSLLDTDSHFFINVVRLKRASVPEFQQAYQRLNSYFTDIARLLVAADSPSPKDRMYREARKRLSFHEVNGINLGVAKHGMGAGWGDVISDQVLRDAYQIVKKGSEQPEIFHLVGLFEENVAGDRLSDMIATIILPDIKSYTLRVLGELGVSPLAHPGLTFQSDGLVRNPYKNVPILLLPEEILHELPIARDWYDMDRVASENATIRREMSGEIGEQWAQWASVRQKRYLKEHVFMDPVACERVIEGYRELDLSPLDVRGDADYLAEILLRKMREGHQFEEPHVNPTSFEAAMTVVRIFKDWVENNRGWAEIQQAPTKVREKAVQRLIHLGAKYYVDENDLDLSFESDEGRGPLDIKMSRGGDRTIAEVKLSSNPQYMHGYEAQVEEYGRAERTRSLVYVFVDVGNPGKVTKLRKLHAENRRKGLQCPELVVVDARERRAASTYDGAIGFPEIEPYDFTVPDLSGLEIPDMDAAAMLDEGIDYPRLDGFESPATDGSVAYGPLTESRFDAECGVEGGREKTRMDE